MLPVNSRLITVKFPGESKVIHEFFECTEHQGPLTLALFKSQLHIQRKHNHYLKNYLYYVHCGIIHNNEVWKQPRRPQTDERVKEMWSIDTQQNIFQPEKRRKSYHYNNMDQTGGYYAKQNKEKNKQRNINTTNREKQILHGITYIQNLKIEKLNFLPRQFSLAILSTLYHVSHNFLTVCTRSQPHGACYIYQSIQIIVYRVFLCNLFLLLLASEPRFSLGEVLMIQVHCILHAPALSPIIWAQ